MQKQNLSIQKPSGNGGLEYFNDISAVMVQLIRMIAGAIIGIKKIFHKQGTIDDSVFPVILFIMRP